MNSKFDYLYNILNRSFACELPLEKILFHCREDVPQYEGNYYYNAFKEVTWINATEDDFFIIKKTFKKIKTFGFFTAEGFAYYLPAFILYFSKNKDEDLMQSFYFRLTPGSTGESVTRHREMLSCLNDEQVAAVKSSLLALNEIWNSWGESGNEAGAALAEFWSCV